MSDLDIINNLTSTPERPPEHISLEEIVTQVPCMDWNNPTLYTLYMFYNPHLEQEEREKCEAIIEKFKRERANINAKNIEYMERHKKEAPEEVPEPTQLVRS